MEREGEGEPKMKRGVFFFFLPKKKLVLSVAPLPNSPLEKSCCFDPPRCFLFVVSPALPAQPVAKCLEKELSRTKKIKCFESIKCLLCDQGGKKKVKWAVERILKKSNE